jgi:hypothetical protein
VSYPGSSAFAALRRDRPTKKIIDPENCSSGHESALISRTPERDEQTHVGRYTGLNNAAPERGSGTRSSFANPDGVNIRDGFLASTLLRPIESRSVPESTNFARTCPGMRRESRSAGATPLSHARAAWKSPSSFSTRKRCRRSRSATALHDEAHDSSATPHPNRFPSISPGLRASSGPLRARFR